MNDLGIVSACGNTPDYFKIKCPSLSIDTIIYGGSFTISQGIKFMNGDNKIYSLWFDDSNKCGCSIGTFYKGGAGYNNSYGGVFNSYDTLRITQGGTIGQSIVGSFSVYMTPVLYYEPVNILFTGSFKMHLK